MRKLGYFGLVVLALGVSAPASHAAMAKTYQVTGPVVSVTSDTIVVQKGKDNWELGRDASTKVTAEPKVGDKVTIEYRMTATSIESKPAAAKTTTKKKK